MERERDSRESSRDFQEIAFPAQNLVTFSKKNFYHLANHGVWLELYQSYTIFSIGLGLRELHIIMVVTKVPKGL